TRHAWHQWMYYRQVVKELEQQLSFYEHFESRADLRYRLGESSLLEKKLIENSLYELRNEHMMRSEDLRQARNSLQFLLGVDDSIIPAEDTLISLAMPDTVHSDTHPTIDALEEIVRTRKAEASVEKALFFPEI